LVLDLLQKRLAGVWAAVAPVREWVDEHAVSRDALPLAQFETAEQMAQQAVYADIAADAQQVYPATAELGGCHRVHERLILKKLALADGHRDAHRFLINDAPGSDVLMAHLAVAHRAIGQA